MTKKPAKTVLNVKPYSYQPSKEELEADVTLNATPEQLASAILQDVTIKPQK